MNIHHLFPFALGAVVLILVGAYLLGPMDTQVLSEEEPQTVAETPEATSTEAVQAPAPLSSKETEKEKPALLTMADVALHASPESCYTAIGGEVYDLTSWIGKHPGGQAAILSLCGKDGTAAFEGQHGGQRRPEAELASFRIGTLSS